MEIKAKDYLKIIEKMQKIMQDKKMELTELDAAIGDGDHGLNMNKGFSQLYLNVLAKQNLAVMNRTVATTLMTKVGGASGPLYGTMFMKFSKVLAGKNVIDDETFILMLKEAKKGIETLGKAMEGEKTMLDAIGPFIREMEKSKDLELAIKAAFEATEKTKEYRATKGRASYLGERSIGHQDPGATSFSYLMSCFK